MKKKGKAQTSRQVARLRVLIDPVAEVKADQELSQKEIKITNREAWWRVVPPTSLSVCNADTWEPVAREMQS